MKRDTVKRLTGGTKVGVASLAMICSQSRDWKKGCAFTWSRSWRRLSSSGCRSCRPGGYSTRIIPVDRIYQWTERNVRVHQWEQYLSSLILKTAPKGETLASFASSHPPLKQRHILYVGLSTLMSITAMGSHRHSQWLNCSLSAGSHKRTLCHLADCQVQRMARRSAENSTDCARSLFLKPNTAALIGALFEVTYTRTWSYT